MTDPTAKARDLLAAATQEIKSFVDGDWRDSHEVGREMIAKEAAQHAIVHRAEDTLRVAIGLAEAASPFTTITLLPTGGYALSHKDAQAARQALADWAKLLERMPDA